MIAQIGSELRKFVSTRMGGWLLLLMVGYMAFLAATMAFALTGGQVDSSTPTQVLSPLALVRAVYTIAVSLGYVFPVIVGTLAVTAEFRHHTIATTFLFEPSRTRFVLAKFAAMVPVGLAFGVAGIGAGVGAGAGVLAIRGHATMLNDASVWASIGMGVAALTVWALVGVGVGLMVTNQVAAVVIILAFTQFVEPIARMALPAALGAAGSKVASFLPGAAGESMAQGSIYSAFTTGSLLSWWQGALVLIAYALVFAAIGRLTTLRRDV
ncbi:ABC transporter permease [Rarobacter incanus]|uniref:ABC-2 family transporter n=1 Tax=Rarobacter incanus TaxID=153494 RepID=A0A542SQS1_9MICO|nr:ABC transporter permease [Rarobacter incanus]TQK76952.1 hypothetical protein FB389_1655 [Rarobacter incanus]